MDSLNAKNKSQLVQQAKTFDTMLTSLKDFVYSFDLEGRFTYANKALLDLLLLTLPEIKGKNFHDLPYPSQLAKTLQAYIEKVKQTGLLVSDVTPYTSPSGIEGIYEYIFTPVFNEHKEIISIAGLTRDVTERYKADVAIKEERRRLFEVFMQAPAMIAVVKGSDLIFDLANNLYLKVVGKTHDIIGKSVQEVFPEIQNQGILEILHNVFSSGQGYKGTEVLMRLDTLNNGTLTDVYFDFVYEPYKSDLGIVEGILVHAVDVTAPVMTRKKLEDSEEKFRTLSDNIPNLAWIADADGYIFWYNKRWYEYTGKTQEEMEGWGWQSLHHPEHLPRVLEDWKDIIANGKPYDLVFPLRGVDGHYRTFLTRVEPVKDNYGTIIRWLGTNTDITEQEKAKQQIIESEQRFKTMAESIDILISTCNEYGNCIYFNRPWTLLTGRSMEDLSKKGWTDLIHIEDRKTFLDLYSERFNKRASLLAEIRIMNANKEYRWMMVQAQPRFNIDTSFAGYISSSVDITERKESEKSLEHKNTELIRINNDLDNFIYTASHDLKAPISNLEGLLNNFKEITTFDEDQNELLDMMFLSIERFKTTIKDLTEISMVQRIDPKDLQSISFEEILNEVKLDIRELFEKFDPTVSTNFEVANINFSRKNLRSIIYNLISNALKYSSPERKPIVYITSEKIQKYTLLKISDNGLGLSLKDQGKIFGMFKRAHQHVEGTGVGLYMIKRMIENAGGKIEIESEENVGSTFAVYLPDAGMEEMG